MNMDLIKTTTERHELSLKKSQKKKIKNIQGAPAEMSEPQRTLDHLKISSNKKVESTHVWSARNNLSIGQKD